MDCHIKQEASSTQGNSQGLTISKDSNTLSVNYVLKVLTAVISRSSSGLKTFPDGSCYDYDTSSGASPEPLPSQLHCLHSFPLASARDTEYCLTWCNLVFWSVNILTNCHQKLPQKTITHKGSDCLIFCLVKMSVLVFSTDK